MRMVRTLRAELGMSHGTVKRVARQLGYGVESVRSWIKQAEIDGVQMPRSHPSSLTPRTIASRRPATWLESRETKLHRTKGGSEWSLSLNRQRLWSMRSRFG